MTRPPDPGELDSATRDLVALTGLRNNGTPLAIIEMLAHQPALVAPFLTWSAALAEAQSLGLRRHEIVAVRTSWHYASPYEWGNHARYALAAGVSADELAALGEPAAETPFADPADRAVIALVDVMCAQVDATSARQQVEDLLGPAALIEVAWTVAQYAGLSLVANSLDIAVGDDLPPLPPRH